MTEVIASADSLRAGAMDFGDFSGTLSDGTLTLIDPSLRSAADRTPPARKAAIGPSD
jgi:hypothetical protein